MPAAKPTKLKILTGRGDGKDSAGRALPEEPAFEREAPEPPPWLTDEALEEWERVAPSLEALDLLKPEDRAAFAAYCETWARYVGAVAEYRRDGLTVINPDSGRVGKHPAVSIAENAGAQLVRFANEFGLTPAAERKISKAPDGGEGSDDPYSGSTAAS